MSTAAETGRVQLPVAGDYRIDPDSSTISFTTRHLFGLAPVRGTFRLRAGHIQVADPVTDSSVRVTISSASFHTGLSARDVTVRSATYLDAERHPDITFSSTRSYEMDGRWVLVGSLTVRGVSRVVEVGVEESRVAGSRLRLRAVARVDRYEFGITAMKGMTGRRLAIELDVLADRR